ncbi:MAG: NAD-dependent malic enzyme [Planctomycetes bacterium]|nr:NAD-dependent malic enzyme [Planctomycetota bacterium]
MAPKLHPSAQYSITVRLSHPHSPGWIAKISAILAEHQASIAAIDLVHVRDEESLRDFSIECTSLDHAHEVVDALKHIDEVNVHSVSDKTFLMHLGGKLEIQSKVPLTTRNDLSMAYTPGVARVCKAIARTYESSFNLTIRKNCIAVVSNGTAVLGLGDIGAAAAMPVMEGKAILFKEFGGVDAFPLCIDAKDPKDVIQFCRMVAPTLGGINLEDIKAPECFEIEATLERELDIPVFHDDQHGTAVVVLAALINSLRLTKRDPEGMRVVVTGAGAAGHACAKILLNFGIRDIVLCDRKGAIWKGRESFEGNPAKAWLAENSNPRGLKGSVHEVLEGADMFLGVSGPGLLAREDIERMGPKPLVFALSNPTPEILPEEAHDLAGVMATGRSDYPNQINNVLAFPGIFRGALDCRARNISEDMKIAAAHAIADMIPESDLSPDYIIPSVFHKGISKAVAKAVAQVATQAGIARRTPKMTISD